MKRNPKMERGEGQYILLLDRADTKGNKFSKYTYKVLIRSREETQQKDAGIGENLQGY